MPSYSSTPLAVISGQAIAQGVATEITLSGLPPLAVIRRVRVVLGAGAGATVAPVLATKTAGSGTISQIWSASAAAVVEAASIYVPFASDASGRIFLTPACDAGADNVVDYQIWYTT